MTSGRIKRSFSKSAVIAAGEYARCRQLVFMPRIKFPFFFFHPLPARLSAAHAARYFRATPSDSRVFDCSSIPPFAISLSFSFRFPFSVRTSTGRVFAIVRFFYIYIYIKKYSTPLPPLRTFFVLRCSIANLRSVIRRFPSFISESRFGRTIIGERARRG